MKIAFWAAPTAEAHRALAALQQYQALLYGVLMIAVMLFLPNGLLSLGRLLAGRSGDGR